MNYTPYSFSKIEVFYSCANKFKLPYIDNIWINSENKHLEKGSFIHKEIEDFLLNQETLPWEEDFEFKLHSKEEEFELRKLSQEIKETDYIQKLKLAVKKSDDYGIEQGFSFVEQDWNISDYRKDSIIRGYIDLFVKKNDLLIVIDHKTGKVKDDRYQSYDQVKLYALWAFKKYPEVQRVKGVYNYVEHDVRKEKVFSREEFPEIEKHFRKKLQVIEQEEKFEKNVTKLCGYCDYFKQGYCKLTDEEMLRVL